MESTRGIPVSIHLKTEVKQENETEEFLFDITGRVIRMGNTLYIRYKEEQEDGSDPVPVTMKIFPDGAVQLVRSGEIRTRLKFIYGEKFETSYQTPYGTIFLTTHTKDLHFTLNDRPMAGKVTIEYDLFVAEQRVGSYHLLLEFSA
ncbi:DUF1934 domain-containing protein [Tetragenococcus solitarius]|uniref:DUF1934 domain-containing protein n=1 Tax=Tetragenococcus solitarius TaxID=71453 RepID=A0ABN3Y3R3_9ENTE|nr:DUF1934 domain-containing protein [Tetragenococcus solitarius]